MTLTEEATAYAADRATTPQHYASLQRAFMAGALAAMTSKDQNTAQMLAECVQFGRAIGTPAETAAQAALEALERGRPQIMGALVQQDQDAAIRDLRAALAAPAPEPDGKLHADGYFTWNRRDGYVMDAKLPCAFYLAAPAQTQLSSSTCKLAPEELPQPVASIYITPGGDREFDDWKCDLPIGRNLLYTAPPQAQSSRDPCQLHPLRADCGEAGNLAALLALAEPAERDAAICAELELRGSPVSPMSAARAGWYAALKAYPTQPVPPLLSDDRIIGLRDDCLPSQGDRFDCLSFARAVEREVRKACGVEDKP